MTSSRRKVLPTHTHCIGASYADPAPTVRGGRGVLQEGTCTARSILPSICTHVKQEWGRVGTMARKHWGPGGRVGEGSERWREEGGR